MTLTKKQFQIFIALVISIFYSFYLSSLPHDLFKDRINYISIYATDFNLYFDLIEENLIAIPFTEPLFFLLNKWLYVFEDPELTVRLIVAFICFSVAFFSLTRFKNIFTGLFFLVFLFYNAQFFAMELVVLRQGLGMAILLLFCNFIHKPKVMIPLLLTLSMIHNSFYLFLLFYLVNWILKDRVSVKKRYMILAVVGLLLNSFILVLSRFLSAKQEYEFTEQSSGAFFIVWIIILAYLHFFKFKNIDFEEKNNTEAVLYDFAMIGLIIYLTSYFISPLAGRIIGTFIPFIYWFLFRRLQMRDIIFISFVFLLNFFVFHNNGAENFLIVRLDEFYDHLFKINL